MNKPEADQAQVVWCPILELTIGETPSPPRQAKRGAPFSPRLMKTPRRATLSPKGGEGRVELAPSPPWGRGWTAAGVLTSRGGKGAPRFACRGGEGVRALSHCHILRGTPH